MYYNIEQYNRVYGDNRQQQDEKRSIAVLIIATLLAVIISACLSVNTLSQPLTELGETRDTELNEILVAQQ